MKKISVFIITCMLLSIVTFGQINILKKITKKVEQKTEQKIDEGIERGVNEVFEGDYKNEKTSKNKKQVEDEEQSKSDENTDEKKQTKESNSTSQLIEDQIKELLKSIELTRFKDIKQLLEPNNNIDEAINQESLNLIAEVLLSAPKKKYEHSQAEKNRNEAPHIEEMIKEYQKELNQEIKDYFELINFLITKGAKVGYLNNDGNNTLSLFLKTFDSLRRLSTVDLIGEKNKIYELIVDKATGIDIIYAAQNIFELESFKKAVDRAPDINLVVETEHKQKRNALHHIIISLQQQSNQKVNVQKAIYLLEKGIKVFENNWWKQNEDLGLISCVLVFAGTDFENTPILCKKLIEAGADVNLVAFNRTPLYELSVVAFIWAGGEELFELLLEKGADVNFSFNKLTALDRVLTRNSDKAKRIVELLKSKGAKTFSELNQ